MEIQKYLLVSINSTEMVNNNKMLSENAIITELVPAPPESGSVCAIAIRFDKEHLLDVENILQKNKSAIKGIYPEKKMKLAGFLEKKLGLISEDFIKIVNKIIVGDDLDIVQIDYLLSTDNKKEIETIFSLADTIRQKTVGDVVEIRAAIEFSNYCKKACSYCGINRTNQIINRYRMSDEDILRTVGELDKIGIKTVILQSGEDEQISIPFLMAIMRSIKETYNMRITLSVGEKTFEEYKTLKEAGADNFLLKIETTNKEIFKEIHPDDDYDYRVQCHKWLKELGYITGSGNMIGLPGQKTIDIASDIVFFKEMGINMIGVGPFIPAQGTRFEELPHGSVDLTLRTVAVTRIVCKNVYIPATTALASLDKEAQVMALNAGANSVMLISTPENLRKNYCIYDNKNMIDINSALYAINKAKRKIPAYIKSNEGANLCE